MLLKCGGQVRGYAAKVWWTGERIMLLKCGGQVRGYAAKVWWTGERICC